MTSAPPCRTFILTIGQALASAEVGALVKLDTNGTNPELLKKLVEEKTVDYVAMDIKAPIEKEKYGEAAGIAAGQLFENVKSSIKFLMQGKVGYEFRTTVVPGMHNEKDIEEIAKYIQGAKKYALQKFEQGNCLDPEFNELKTQSDEEMEHLVEVARKYVRNVKWRGRIMSLS